MERIQLRLPCANERELIKKYLYLLKSYFKFTEVEIEVLSSIMEKAITGNGELADVLNYEGRLELSKELQIKKGTFDVTLNRLKRKNAIYKFGKSYKLTQILRSFKFNERGCILEFNLSLINAE